jgi:hypothetical protein
MLVKGSFQKAATFLRNGAYRTIAAAHLTIGFDGYT